MNIKPIIVFVLFVIPVAFLSAQVSFTYQVTNATCSSNGSIQISASGGTGTLNYQLSSTCLQLPLTQQSSTFNNLPPCLYTVTVTDGSSGASATQTVSVGGNYQNLDLTLMCGNCAVEALVTGGASPLTFSISTGGLGGPYQTNTPSSNPSFTNIQSGTNYWVKVTDACGNFSVETCQTSGNALTNFTFEVGVDGNLNVTGVTGGNGNYLYTLTNSNGSFSNTSGIFPQTEWGCAMSLTVSDGCTEITKSVSLRPKILSICSNFAEGTATLGNVINGIPPFTFNYISPSNVTTSTTTNELTGLPINSSYYLFQVVDACGNKSDAIYKQKKYPLFQQDPPVSCSDNSISLFTPNGGCGGGFDADSWPFVVTCLTCSPVETKQVDTAGISITFNGSTPGNWELAVEDGCEDQMVCRDSVILLLKPVCDSVQALLIDRFTCDNGAISDRPMSTSGGLFVLFDENDNVLSTNTTGLFYVPDSGSYKVALNIPNCDLFEAEATLGYWQAVDPVLRTYIYNTVISGSCQTVYQLVINPEDGPFYLTGGPNNVSMLIDGDNLTSSCLSYSITSLLPGDYQLAEVDHCGVKNLHLPAPEFNLEAIPFGNCPGSGTITVSGAMNLVGWQDWGTANNATINWPSSITDNYSLDAVGPVNSQNGSPFTFVNVAAGEHTVYLYTLNSACPIDTAIIFVPEADTLSFDVSSGILCDGVGATTLEFEILSGKPPFVIEQVDCNNPAVVLATFNVQDSTIALPGFTFGDYCFRLIDSCVTSIDHQFSVQYFQDDIELAFNCDNTLTLSVDSLNATYSWLDENGNTVGNGHKINLPNPTVDATFTVFVNIGECIINRSITVPSTEIVPVLSIQGEPYFCQNDTVVLTAETNASQIVWGNGESSTSIATAIPGNYTVTVTNNLGCTATAAFLLTLDIPEAEIQILSGGSGFGLKCFQDSNGVLLANPLAGIPPFEFEWSNLEFTPQIANLKTNDYTVTLTDAIGCKDTTLITLTEPELFVPEFDLDSPRCFGIDDGYFEITGWSGGAGGVKAKLQGSQPVVAPIAFDNLPPGDFFIEIFDANGCTVDTSFRLDAPEELFMKLGDDITIELGDSVHVNPEISFTPVDSFAWISNTVQPLTELSFLAKPLKTVYYYLTVWDEKGCSLTDKMNIRVTKDLDVYVPNSFSPNGDGINDLFTIYARASAVRTVRQFQIFDRFGEKVFLRENFDPNEEPMGWDGRLDGQPMNPAVFVWKAEIEFVDGRVIQLFGDMNLMN
ncbi:MAG: gliding motility-associated C-terminal domain-containing protein [Saprospiraceae bacterium]|nr:gliding motility-associated C-terminal domain-containing protein [Saprospiraceae bacterium]MCF8248545.1 gliding motility-associated C-terminal domain-containing protein [Saprospiraceae bacterium]MCF8280288.1 gliding motility-associated C-terminal domain-containing protein [Bacteroidales bacterium]MCF8310279.1 gliding motility-associated C-terminal domain-containing protein [Saprospiraceae bacterium]MCF8439282.1 gliding motility-associated C-terminal domain-containing protein [Saprospiraceae 